MAGCRICNRCYSVSASEWERTGQLLIDALRTSPHRDIEIEPRRSVMPVLAVKL